MPDTEKSLAFDYMFQRRLEDGRRILQAFGVEREDHRRQDNAKVKIEPSDSNLAKDQQT